MDPTHEPTLRALEAMMAGEQEPLLAAQVLEPIYESGGAGVGTAVVRGDGCNTPSDPPARSSC